MSDDRRYGPHLEATRSSTFYFSKFSELEFRDDHAHCIACDREIAEHAWPGAVEAGYVMLSEMAHKAGTRRQWQWVCPCCFADFHVLLDWKLSESPPDISLRCTLGPAQVSEDAHVPKDEYARTSWSADDIAGIAGLLGYNISTEEAHRFLRVNERFLKKKMEGVAYAVIQQLLHRANLPRK